MLRYFVPFLVFLLVNFKLFAQCEIILVATDTSDIDVIRIAESISESSNYMHINFVLADRLESMTEDVYILQVLSGNQLVNQKFQKN